MKQKSNKINFRVIIFSLLIISFVIPFTSIASSHLPSGVEPCTNGKVFNGTDCVCPPGQDDINPQTKIKDGICRLSNPAAGQLVNIDNFPDLAKLVINTLLGIAGAIAVIFLVIGGFQYVISRGNEEAMETAKKTIYGAIIGIVVIVMSYAVVVIINNVLTRDPDEPVGYIKKGVQLVSVNESRVLDLA